MERKADFVYNICLGAALILLTQLAVAWDRTVGESHWWDIVSALGTAAAAVVALWLGTRDIRQRRADRAHTALAVRAMLEMELHAVAVSAEKLPRSLEKIHLSYLHDDGGEQHINMLRFTAMRLVTPTAESNFAFVLQLEEQESLIVAHVIGEARRLKRTLEDWADHYSMFHSESTVISGCSSRAKELAETIRMLPWVAKE